MNLKPFFLLILVLPLLSHAQKVELVAKMPDKNLHVEQLMQYKGELYIIGAGTSGASHSTPSYMLFKYNNFGKAISFFPNDQEKFLYDTREMVKSGQYLFIRTGTEIYRTDGTESGTIFLSNYDRDTKVIIPVKNGKVVFPVIEGSHRALKVSDGTLSGSYLLKVIDGYVSAFVSDGTIAYFVTMQTVGSDYTLWKTDGTESGTIKITALSGGVPGNLKLFGETLFFNIDNLIVARGKNSLWTSDGTAEGTHPLSFTFKTSSYVIAKSGNNFLLYGYDEEGSKIFTYDGHNAPVQILGPYGDRFVAGEGAVFEDVILFNFKFVDQLWQSDCSKDGTFKIADLTTDNGVFQFGGIGFYTVTKYDNKIGFHIFSYNDKTGFQQEETPAQIFASTPDNFLVNSYGFYFTARQDTTDNIWFVENKAIVSGEVEKAFDTGINIYPIPSTGTITIDAGSAGNYRIFNTTGQNIYYSNNSKSIEIVGLSPGLYIAEFSNDEKFQRKTFIICE